MRFQGEPAGDTQSTPSEKKIATITTVAHSSNGILLNASQKDLESKYILLNNKRLHLLFSRTLSKKVFECTSDLTSYNQSKIKFL